MQLMINCSDNSITKSNAWGFINRQIHEMQVIVYIVND